MGAKEQCAFSGLPESLMAAARAHEPGNPLTREGVVR